MSTPKTFPLPQSSRLLPLLGSLVLLAGFIAVWHTLTARSEFSPAGLTEEQLLEQEFNGDIVRDADGNYSYNPDKQRGFPSPADVWRKIAEETADPFHTHGTNDHGIALLVWYTIKRFAIGFTAA